MRYSIIITALIGVFMFYYKVVEWRDNMHDMIDEIYDATPDHQITAIKIGNAYSIMQTQIDFLSAAVLAVLLVSLASLLKNDYENNVRSTR